MLTCGEFLGAVDASSRDAFFDALAAAEHGEGCMCVFNIPPEAGGPITSMQVPDVGSVDDDEDV